MGADRLAPGVEELFPDYAADAREALERVCRWVEGADAPVAGEAVDLDRGLAGMEGGAQDFGLPGLGRLAGALRAAVAAGGGDGAPPPEGLAEACRAAETALAELEARGVSALDLEAIAEAVAAGAPLPPAGREAAPCSAGPCAPPPEPLGDIDDEEVLQEFFTEAWELIDAADRDLVALENDPGDGELLQGIFRAVHTLKGSSGMLGFRTLCDLAHRLEDVFSRLRAGEMEPTPETMDAVLAGVDRVRRLLGAAQAGEALPDVADVLAALQGVLDGPDPRRLGEILVEDEGVAPEAVERALQGRAEGQRLGDVLVAAHGVPPEAVERSLAKQGRAPAGSAGQTVRVDVERLDGLMNLVGELVLGKNRLAGLRHRAERGADAGAVAEELSAASAQIERLTEELQRAVIGTRLVPIGTLFRRFPRLVRDLARTLGKEIRLVLDGEGTELDRSVVEHLADPMVHLIRNAADHGLEPPDEREAGGKPRQGVIRLSARHRGNHILVTVEDDGRGMDPEALRRKAVEKGVLTPEEAKGLGNAGALRLIFAPGFSAARRVTELSGRGVGMDVVKTHVQQVSGVIDVVSTPGEGTRFELRIPLTLAIAQALLVRSGPEVYAVPLSSVVETVRILPGEIGTVSRRPVLRRRDRILPLVELRELFRVPAGAEPESPWRYVVVVGLAEERLGLLVDALAGEEEVVIKSLGEYLSGIPGIAGATVRGDGRVTLIVDVNQLLRMAVGDGRAPAHRVAA
ncbi:MAG: chemotaxis protein CheA [Deferrisomatales bacterium]